MEFNGMPQTLNKKALEKQIHKITPNALKIVAPTLKRDLENQGIPNNEKPKILNAAELKKLEERVYRDIKKFDKVRRLPYHNVQHTMHVYKRTRSLLAKASLNQSDEQVVKVAALFHDYEHGIRDGKLPKDGLSFEERSASRADEVALELGFSMEQRLKLYGAIIGTTFSDPNIRPMTSLEKILVIADLGGFNNSSKNWLIESLCVTQEIPKAHRPKDVNAWLVEQQKFLKYVKLKLTPEAKDLSWNEALEKKDRLIKKMMENPHFHKGIKPVVKEIEKALR